MQIIFLQGCAKERSNVRMFDRKNECLLDIDIFSFSIEGEQTNVLTRQGDVVVVVDNNAMVKNINEEEDVLSPTPPSSQNRLGLFSRKSDIFTTRRLRWNKLTIFDGLELKNVEV